MGRWNRTLKTGVQAFCVVDQPWDLGILELLMQHRSMPSMPQGESPAEKFLGRCMRMSFKLVAVTSDEAMNADAHADMPTNMHLHADTHGLEACSQVTITAKRGSDLVSCGSSSVKQINLSRLHPLFSMGEQILVKAGPVPKGSSLYHGPYMVEEILG